MLSGSWPWVAVVGLAMVAQARLARTQFGSWLAPPAFFASLWVIFVASCLVVAPEYRIWPGVLWFFAMNCTVHLGAVLGSSLGMSAGKAPRGAAVRVPSARVMSIAIAGCVVLGLAAGEVLLRSAGQSVLVFASRERLTVMALGFSRLRYEQAGFREPTAFVFLSVFVYAGAYFSGMLFAVSRRPLHRAGALAIFVPALLIAATLTTRASILYCAINWVAGYLATIVWLGRARAYSRLSRKVIAGATIAALLAVAAYAGLQTLRSGAALKFDTSIEEALEYGLENAKAAYVGSLAAFSGWFARNWDTADAPAWGRYTFASTLQWFGARYRRFPDAQISPDPDAPVTNVYTIYRQFAEDFTLPGAGVLTFLIGLAGGWSYIAVGRGSLLALPPLVLFYQISLGSLTGFALRDTTLQVAFALLVCYVLATAGLRLPAAGKGRPALAPPPKRRHVGAAG